MHVCRGRGGGGGGGVSLGYQDPREKERRVEVKGVAQCSAAKPLSGRAQ